MNTLCIILARAGSKGLPCKNSIPLCGQPMVAYTIDHALAAVKIDHVVLSTDGDAIAQIGRDKRIDVIMRPDDLAGDTATVDAAARHAVRQVEKQQTGNVSNKGTYTHIVILYGNIPLRPFGLIDHAIEKLQKTNCDSVQSVCPVGKNHPYWMKTLTGSDDDTLEHYQPNNIYRRQDLPPVYQLDGGIIAVSRDSLFAVKENEPHAFLGNDRRAIVTKIGEVMDVDEPKDLHIAAALLEEQQQVNVPKNGLANLPGYRDNTYIIAELGVNHDGSIDRALELTHYAKQAGANAVKLQLFEPKLLLSAEAKLANYQEGVANDPFEMLLKLQLSVDEMLQVKQLAHELGMGFIVTPFSVENEDELKRLDPDVIKIASPDCVNHPLLDVCVKLNKPMFISTGAADEDELWQTHKHLTSVPFIVYLACVSSYPVPVEQASLNKIKALASLGEQVGYSDHTDQLIAGALAVAAGATVIEKHLTYDQNAKGPDHAASFDPDHFKIYIDHIRLCEAMNQQSVQPVLSCLDIERDVRLVARQSVCAVRAIKRGQILKREDITIKRPGTGIPANQIDKVVGQQLKNDITANHLIHDKDI